MKRQISGTTRRPTLGALALALLAPLLMAAPRSAHAQEEAEEGGPDYRRNGAYLAMSGAYTPSYKGQSSVGGLNTRLGYRFTRGLAGELEFEYMNPSDFQRTTGMDLDIDSYHLSLNLKTYPSYKDLDLAFLDDRLQLFLNFGLGVIMVQDTDSDEPEGSLLDQAQRFAARLGGGAEFYVTDKLVVVAEGAWKIGVRSTVKINSDIDYASFTLGLQYRF